MLRDEAARLFSWEEHHRRLVARLVIALVLTLTVSSQIRNPLTAAGKCIDVGLELWALFVVAAIAGSFAAFFTAASG